MSNQLNLEFSAAVANKRLYFNRNSEEIYRRVAQSRVVFGAQFVCLKVG